VADFDELSSARQSCSGDRWWVKVSPGIGLREDVSGAVSLRGRNGRGDIGSFGSRGPVDASTTESDPVSLGIAGILLEALPDYWSD